MSITDTQSYSEVIRDSLFAAAVTLPFFQGFTARRCRQLPIAKEHLPFLGVYIVDELMGPVGDINVGDIRFRHSLNVGFSVIIIDNDPVASELTLDAAFWALMNGLWRDVGITNFINTAMPDDTHIEGIERGTRKHIWGASGANNETPIAELEYVASLVYRTSFWPVINDDLLRMHVEIVPVEGGKPVPPAAQVQRIIAEYEFTPARRVNSERRPQKEPTDG